ncbi:MAG: hypothetical protein GC146_10255 [Limimaricola sp.]|uniref:hypothetical protein n=1 Tax=Limimaricola sp. TaxID=2211665 RepID=UPI001D307414|nr:hypothetical protein [Limimaricola sp.]MBI1417591.1 hypothetical protein [Limimaricola sp.]
MKIVENSAAVLVMEHRPLFGPIIVAALFVVVLCVSLLLVASGNGNLMMLGLFLMVVGCGTTGLLFFALSKRVRLRLDRGAGLVTLTITGRRKTTEQSLRLSDLDHTEVDTMRAMSAHSDNLGGTTSSESHGVVLIFGPQAATQRLVVTPVYTSGGGAKRNVAAINAWLGVKT